MLVGVREAGWIGDGCRFWVGVGVGLELGLGWSGRRGCGLDVVDVVGSGRHG